MSELSDLIAACGAVATDTHAAASTKRMARALGAWAPTVAPPPPPPVTPVPVGALMFSDTFTGTTLDLAKWEAKQYTDKRTGNVWTGTDSITLSNGLLHIVATKSTAGVWRSAFISGKQSYTGPRYMECRAQVAAGLGAWSAPLWEWDAPYGEFGVENDVCEQLGKDPTMYHATVHSDETTDSGHEIWAGSVLDIGFHRYGCAMYASHADYFLDGKLVLTILAGELPAWTFTVTPMVANVSMYLGGWGGPIDPALTSATMLVDYVNVWKLA